MTHTPPPSPHALILAAGRGERMRPLSDTTPKPLMIVGGKPLIEWHLIALAQAGVRHVVINTAWLEDQIIQSLGDGSRWGVHIHYSTEGKDHGQALETAGGMAKALPWLGDVFWVISSDSFLPQFTFDPQAVSAFTHSKMPGACRTLGVDSENRPQPDQFLPDLPPHSPAMERKSGENWAGWGRFAGDEPKSDRFLAHLWLVPNAPHHPEGDFSIDDQGKARNHSPRLTWGSVGLFRASLVNHITAGQKAALGPLLRTACDLGQVSAQTYSGPWIDVGTPERLYQAQQWCGA